MVSSINLWGGGGGAAVGISEGDASVKAQTQVKCVDMHLVQSGWGIERAGGKTMR